MIHTQDLLAIIEMNYPIGVLKGEVYRAVSGLLSFGANYSIAADILRRRFGNTDLTRHSISTKLRNLAVSNERTANQGHIHETNEKNIDS